MHYGRIYDQDSSFSYDIGNESENEDFVESKEVPSF